MTTVQKAKTVLLEAEAALRKLMEEGIRDHRYSEVAEVAALANALMAILIPANADQPYSTAPTSSATAPALTRISEPSRARRQAKPAFPRFERDGDKLVKVGWSKKHKDEYEHRAPREAVASIARHLVSHVKVGHVFEVEDILPVLDSASSEIPAYQVYLTMAWLREAGSVEKKGRDGHVLRDASIASTGFDKLWEAIPKRAA